LPLSADSATSCSSATLNDEGVGSQTADTATAVTADINPNESSDGFQECTAVDLVHGTFAWISLSSTQADNGLAKIVQIGIAYCHLTIPNPFDDVCDDRQDVRSLFWAIGGCNGHGADAKYIGPASGGDAYHFSIIDDALYQRWVLKYQTPYPGSTLKIAAYVPWSDPAVNCWATDAKVATATAERWDPGDGWGSSAHPIVYTNANWQHATATWYNFGGGSCYSTAPDGHCVGTATGYNYWDS
jgi:hypothetical protein